MDISVSRLNGRLAQKLPPELPLGLVFVVGKVVALGSHDFVLAEETHRLTCRTEEAITSIAVGDEVRVSGHLMFDNKQLQYYLHAGDIERITPEPLGHVDPRELLLADDGLLAALEDVQTRATVAQSGHEEALPVWVKKLAPAEVGLDVEPNEAEKDSYLRRMAEGELNAELVALLSDAMDSEEEMELTPEILAPFLPAEPDPKVDEAEEEMMADTAVSQPALSTSYQPADRRDTDWLVILLIISFFVLTIAAVITIILLLLQ